MAQYPHIIDMANFIREYEPECKQVTSIKAKDCDDEHGIIGEHFVVRCLVGKSAIPRTCLVNVQRYREFEQKRKPVKWLN